MFLSRLQVNNFRQYKELDLGFPDGITGIVGKNGSGKSTILEAILWCLFGSRAARTGKEGIKRQTASPSDTCQVRLDFGLGDKNYCLTRSLIGKTNRTEASLTQHGKLDAVTTREVDEYIIKLIGMNLKGFLSSFFARQKELNALSDARPADRKDHLAKMLGVGRLDNAIDLLKEEIKETRQRIDILSSLQIDPEAVGWEYDEKKAELSRLKSDRQKDVEELDKLDKITIEHVSKVDSLRKKEQEFNRLEKDRSSLAARKVATEEEIGRLKTEIDDLTGLGEKKESLKKESSGIEQLQKAVENLRQARHLVEDKNRLEDELKALQQGLQKCIAEKTTLESRVRELSFDPARKNDLKKAIKDTEKAVESRLLEHRHLSGELRVVENNLDTLLKQKDEIAQLGPEAFCNLCLRPFAGELDQIEKHFDEEILSLRQKAEPIGKRIEVITGEGKILRQSLTEYKAEEEKLAEKEKKLIAIQAEIKSLAQAALADEKRFREIKKRLETFGEVAFDASQLAEAEISLKKKQEIHEDYIRLVERLARLPEIEKERSQSENRLAALITDLDKNQKELEILAFNEDAYRQALAELEITRNRAGEVKIGLERSDGRIRLLTSEASSLEQKIKDFEKSKKEISELRETLTYLEKLNTLFADFRLYLIGRIRPTLSKTTSQLFYEMTGGRYQDIELDEDYSLRVFDRGDDFPISRFSGGEIDLANLCFRLAISIEMAATAGIEQSFIILDEIFGSQDAGRQRMIFEGLGGLKNRFRQIIIISHIEDVKEMAEHIVAVEIDDDGISRVTTATNG